MAEQPEWKVDDQVLCKGKHAIVRFVGETSFAPGTVYVGLEFTKSASGRHDGSVNGVRYFGPTEENHGLFMKCDSATLKVYTAQDAAATTLQAQVRRRQDVEKHQFNQAFAALGSLESRAESEALRTSLSVSRTRDMMDDEAAAVPASLRSTATIACEEAVAVEDGSDAPVIQLQTLAEGEGFTVSRETLDSVVKHLKTPGASPLRFSCLLRLLRASMDLLRRQSVSPLLEIESPLPPGRCVVVGDTHGQLEDLLWIIFEQGEPSRENVFIINGDVCDRGVNAVEIMIIIMLYKLFDPGCIHMNRGNHESANMNEYYGFLDECIDKWGQTQGTEVFELFNNYFCLLPLFTVVDKSVFIVHGGLWRKQFTLKQLRRVDSNQPIPDKPGNGLDAVLFDSVWSDPQEHSGVGSNSRGDNIVSFGQDVTRRFLKANKLRMLVRSHQVPGEGRGYELQHEGVCATIFSASNYCGDCGNLGGVMLITRDEEDQFCEHWAPSLEELAEYEAETRAALDRIKFRTMLQRKRSLRVSIEKMESSIVKQVQELVVRHKAELFEYWSHSDSSPKGLFRISAAMWREGCATVLDDSLPWVRLQEAMRVADATGEVNYVDFILRYRVAFDASYGVSAAGWERSAWSTIMETLLKSDLPLREALAALDSTHDGLVSGVEFARLLRSCRVNLPPLQARALLRTVVTLGSKEESNENAEAQRSGSHRASVWDLLGRLQVSLPVTNEQTTANPELAAWALPKLRAVAVAVLDDAWKRLVPWDAKREDWPVSKMLAAWFENVDYSQDGFLEYDEFVTALVAIAPKLQQCGCPSDAESLRRLASYCDVLGNGKVNYFELLNSLTWEESLGDEFKHDLQDTVNAAIYFNMAPMRKALQHFDAKNTGRVRPEDFMNGLRVAHRALAQAGAASEAGHLTRGQIDAIAESLPREEDGLIDYNRFLKSFRVVDTQSLS